MTNVLISIPDGSADLLGGMWAAVAVYVFRKTRTNAWSVGVARVIATVVSFALCLLYLWFLPFTTVGMAALIGLGPLAVFATMW